jgi:hypothetical protein
LAVTPLPSRSRRRGLLVACLVLAALLAAPAAPAGAAEWNGRFSIWRNGAFATQYLDASCVGATIQMTLNLIKGTHDHSKGHQLSLLAYAAAHSKYPVEDGGADPEGWTQALVHFGAGENYGWTTNSTMQSALQTAASQLRETGKPVGLLVHFGRHAWLMTGFTATADPATTDDFQVTSAEVVGPLWPSGTLNGEHFDPGPGTWMDTSDLARKFNTYVEPDQPIWYGKYVTVVPDISKANQDGQPGDQSPDLSSATGWIYVYDLLSRRLAVRDFLWLP